MIQARDISFKAGEKYLVQNTTASFEAGRLNLVIGPNGAGKTTFVKMLSGQLPPHTGGVLYAGRPLKEYTTAALARIRAVLSQNIELSFPLSVWEVVMMGRYPHFSGKPEKKDVAACEASMAFFNIADFADRDYTTLSGGEKQRVQFARVMAQIWYPVPGCERYLFLDEPLTFLDVHYQYAFMQQLLKLLEPGDLVVVGVVHDLNLASSYAHNITLLHNGGILATGAPADVLTAAHIQTAYHLAPHIITADGKRYILF